MPRRLDSTPGRGPDPWNEGPTAVDDTKDGRRRNCRAAPLPVPVSPSVRAQGSYMSTTSRFSTHHVPDDGTWYTEGEIVRLGQSSTQARIIKDPPETTRSIAAAGQPSTPAALHCCGSTSSEQTACP